MANMKSINGTTKKVRDAVGRITKTRYWTGKITAESKYPSYSTIMLDSGTSLDVLNTRVATVVGKKVKLGYDPAMPGVLQVLGFRDPLLTSGVKSFFNLFMPNHHKNHEYPAFDTVYIHGAQFMPLNVSFSDFEFDIYGDLVLAEITVYGEVLRADGQWIAATTDPLDISAFIPATPGARYVLIEVDTDGTIIATAGDLALDKYLLVPSDIPAPTLGRHSVCAISLYENQTEIVRDTRPGMPNDVVDLRWSNWNRAGGGEFDMAAAIHDATTSAVSDADELGFWEDAANALRKITWANIKATLKTYFDTLYSLAAHTHAHNDTTSKQGGTTSEYYHLSLTQHDELTQGGLTSLHTHDASELIGGDMLEVFHLVPLDDYDFASVKAMAYDSANNKVYVVGTFTMFDDKIARYDLATGQWEKLGVGSEFAYTDEVNAILIDGDNVYIGGNFVNMNGMATADYIVKYTISTNTYASIGGTLNGAVYALAKLGSDIIVGGDFTNANGISTADYVAKFTPGTSTWASIGGTLNGYVSALLVVGSDLYVAGNFTNANGLATADYIAKWSGSAWSSIGGQLNSYVNALAQDGGVLYVGGGFTNADGIASADYLAQYSIGGGTWAAVPDSSSYVASAVQSLAIHGTYLFVGGWFTGNLARYSITQETWSVELVCNQTVYSLLAISDRLMVGGAFTEVDGVSSRGLFQLFVRLFDTLVYYDDLKADKTDVESGWSPCPETWTRTGNFTFTVSGDKTAKFRKGMKVRYKDGASTFDYGVVASSSFSSPTTTVTLITNDDYLMPAATITDKYVSPVENPEGFPHWFNYTPTYSANGSMTYTSVTTTYAKWMSLGGNNIRHFVLATGTTGGTASTALRATPAVASDGVNYPMVAGYRDATSGGAPVGTGAMSGGYLSVWRADLANFGLGAGRILYIHGDSTF